MKHWMLALLLGATTSFAAGPFVENGGVVVFEAEDFTSQLTHGSDHSWGFSNSIAGFNGTGYMEAVPNTGTNASLSWVSTSPELQYSVNFTNTGTHYVWIRGYATNTSDDSLHAGLDGTTNTAAAITLTQFSTWQWTTNRQGISAVPSITVATTGLHTFSLWMREDGIRVDKVLLTINPTFQPTLGNVFHIPNNPEGDLVAAGIPTMRNPLSAIFSNTPVALYNGSQYQGGGNIGNQLGDGSTIFYKKSTSSTWNSLSMSFYKAGMVNTQNKYYSNSIPANVFSAGDTVQYYFKIQFSDHLPTFVYGKDAQGLTTELESIAQASPFSYKVLAPPTVVTPSPADWRDENIYQIITDRFYDGDPGNNTNNPDGVYAPATGNRIHGGDFKGIQQKLDYVKALGATAIWISPIVRNTSGNYAGYSGWNFYELDPHWGTFADLTNMVAAAHARSLHVILDIICNHGGDLINSADSGYPNFKYPPTGYNMQFRNPAKQYYPPFDTNAINPTISSLFHTNGVIQNFSDTTQVEKGELSNLDDFRTETTFVRTNMANIYQYWVGAADLDGFRVDTTKHVDNGFWQFWSPQMHQYGTGIGKSNFFFFGEALTGDDGAIGYYTGTKAGGNFEYDSMLDYALYFTINSVFSTATGNTKQIEDHYNNVGTYYDPAAQMRLVTFLDNHDQRRFLTSGNANNNTNRLAVALAFLYTARGIPCLYYGTEQAFNGGSDPNNREDMFDGQFEQGPSLGDNFDETHLLFQLVAKLNNFRRNYPALRRGSHVNQWNSPDGPGLFAYTRRFQTQEVFVVFNTAASTQTLTSRSTIYPQNTILVNLLNTNEIITVMAGPQTPSINVPGTSTKVFIAQSQLQPLDPVVTSQSPAHGMTNVALGAQIVLRFSKSMNTNAVQSAFSLLPATSGSFSWSALHDTMTFTTAGAGLPASTTNVIRLATNAVDAVSGNALYAPFETYFVTAPSALSDTIPPTVFINTPISGSTTSGALNIAGIASDDVLVAQTEIRLDGGDWALASGTTNWSFTLNTANFLNGTHFISARSTDSSGNVSPSDSVVVKFFNVPGGYVQRISAGNAGDATNCDFNVWMKDQAYSLGSFGFVGGASGFIGNVIAGMCATAQPLYQNERSGTFRYLFDCPIGIYETTLLEAETSATGPNQRVFNVFIEGQQALTNFDIYAAAGGQNVPLALAFTNAIADSQLEIQFVPQTGNARASGIQVRKIADLDSDGDSIPDWWMLGYFNHPTGEDADRSLANEDADGDGTSNFNEFAADTDPTDANSAFRITNIGVVGPDLTIMWTTRPSKTNQLERSSELGPGASWNSVGSLTIGTGSPATGTDLGAATSPPAFYRVRLVQ